MTLLSALAGGCESWRFAKPADDLAIRTPGSWSAAEKGYEGAISTGWLDSFEDAQLHRLVERSLANNRDLKVAAANLREVQEATRVARARRRPSLDLSGSSGLATTNAPWTRSESYNLGFGASWEVDLWGRLRHLSRAAEAEERAALEDFRGARLSLAGNTAKAWCNLISAERDLELAQLTLDSFEKNLRIIERNYRGTGEGALDIQFGRTNVSSAQRMIESRRLNRDDAARALELLVGQYPEGAMRATVELPKLNRRVPAGLPAQLLERRPDLAAARARLFASAERADAARKALLPSISLTGSAGTPGPQLGNLLDPDFLITSISARFNQVLTEGGAVSAEARAALARNEARLHAYAQTALEAFREVEAALAADRSLAEQERYLNSELQQAVLAESQSERDYSEGIDPNILSVLEAQRRANSARGNMIALRNQRLQNRIDLHLALGGDFSTEG